MATQSSLRTQLLVQMVVLASAAVVLVGVVTALVAGADLGALAAPLLAFWAGSTAVILSYGIVLLDRQVLRPLAALAHEADALGTRGPVAESPTYGSIELDALADRYRHMAANLLDAQSEVVRAEKLAGIGQLAAGVAHEVRNPLGAIATFAEVLRNRGADAQVVDEMRSAIDRIEATVASLLEYARPRHDAASTDTGTAAMTVVEFLRTQGAFGHLRVISAAATGTPPVSMERHALEQVLVNLMLNARDAARSSIRLEVSHHQLVPDHRVESRGSSDDWSARRGEHGERRPRRFDLPAGTDGALIVVADDGMGVADEHRERIFDPFFTTKAPGLGTGLGLSIVARSVHDAGGIVWVDRAREGGAAFKIFLPAAGAVIEQCAS